MKKEKKEKEVKLGIHILKDLDHAKTHDSGSLSAFGLQMLKEAERETGSALWGKKSKALWVELGISWSGEAMGSVIRMLWAVQGKRVPSDRHVWTLRVFWSAEAWTLLAPRSRLFLFFFVKHRWGQLIRLQPYTPARRASGDSWTHGEIDFILFYFILNYKRPKTWRRKAHFSGLHFRWGLSNLPIFKGLTYFACNLHCIVACILTDDAVHVAGVYPPPPFNSLILFLSNVFSSSFFWWNGESKSNLKGW